VNRLYQGWNTNQERLFFVNANSMSLFVMNPPFSLKSSIEDPWREASVSSDFHYKRSTPQQPIKVSESGIHCSDLITRFNIAPDIKAIQDEAVTTFTQWIKEFVPGHQRRSDMPVMPPVEERDGGNSTLPPVDSDPPPVDLGIVNAGVTLNTTQSGASPVHVAPKGAWDFEPIQV
jgi:hypothetical protein